MTTKKAASKKPAAAKKAAPAKATVEKAQRASDLSHPMQVGVPPAV